jgi:hypothetical protein
MHEEQFTVRVVKHGGATMELPGPEGRAGAAVNVSADGRGQLVLDGERYDFEFDGVSGRLCQSSRPVITSSCLGTLWSIVDERTNDYIELAAVSPGRYQVVDADRACGTLTKHRCGGWLEAMLDKKLPELLRAYIVLLASFAPAEVRTERPLLDRRSERRSRLQPTFALGH